MGNLLVLTLCTQSLHRLLGQFVVTHIVHIGPTQVAWAICWYPHCAHRGYIGCMDNLLVLTLCTQGLHRLHGQFVDTHIVNIGPTQVVWAICWYPHCAHRAQIGCMGNLLVLTLCTQSLHRLHGQFVGIHIVNIGATQVAWAICWYPHCAHHIVHIEPTQLVWAICWYSHCAHRPTQVAWSICCTHIVHIGPTQVAWAICWYPHCAHRGYIGCMDNLLVLTLCTQGLHRLHGQFVGTHIVNIGAYIGCMGNLLVPTLCTQGLDRLHGQFVGTHIVHIEPTQVAWAICWYHIVNIGATQVAWAICWYPHCAHRAYYIGCIGCLGNLLVPTLCTQGLHRLHGRFVGTHIVHIGPTQVAWAICWYSHCAHRAYIGCLGNLLVPTF